MSVNGPTSTYLKYEISRRVTRLMVSIIKITAIDSVDPTIDERRVEWEMKLIIYMSKHCRILHMIFFQFRAQAPPVPPYMRETVLPVG